MHGKSGESVDFRTSRAHRASSLEMDFVCLGTVLFSRCWPCLNQSQVNESWVFEALFIAAYECSFLQRICCQITAAPKGPFSSKVNK